MPVSHYPFCAWLKMVYCCIDAIRGCIQKFPDWPPGARTANGTPVTRGNCIVILWVSL